MLVLAIWLVAAGVNPAPAASPQATAAQPIASKSPGPAQAAVPAVSELVVIAPRLFSEPDWSKKLDFDLQGDFTRSDTPYLRARPTDGCKLMAGGATSSTGKSGTAGGLVCAHQF